MIINCTITIDGEIIQPVFLALDKKRIIADIEEMKEIMLELEFRGPYLFSDDGGKTWTEIK